jgi:hypothetical protein
MIQTPENIDLLDTGCRQCVAQECATDSAIGTREYLSGCDGSDRCSDVEHAKEGRSVLEHRRPHHGLTGMCGEEIPLMRRAEESVDVKVYIGLEPAIELSATRPNGIHAGPKAWSKAIKTREAKQ